MSIDAGAYETMGEYHAGFKCFQDWGKSVAQTCDGITTGFRMIDFCQLDGFDRHRCKIKMREVIFLSSKQQNVFEQRRLVFLGGVVTAISVVCV